MAKTSYSLSHTKWMCKYHIVFTPIYYKVREDLITIFKQLYQYKGGEIIEEHVMPDNEKTVAKYIREQEKNDIALDNLSVKRI